MLKVIFRFAFCNTESMCVFSCVFARVAWAGYERASAVWAEL